MKTLVAYFSWSGTTKYLAKQIAGELNSDLYQIEPLNSYSTDYETCAYKEAIKEKEIDARPSIKGVLPSIDEYDKVLLLFPIWWYTMPQIIKTFLEQIHYNHKEVYLFPRSYSHDETYLDNVMKDAYSCDGDAVIKRGIYNADKTSMNDFLKFHGFIKKEALKD